MKLNCRMRRKRIASFLQQRQLRDRKLNNNNKSNNNELRYALIHKKEQSAPKKTIQFQGKGVQSDMKR